MAASHNGHKTNTPVALNPEYWTFTKAQMDALCKTAKEGRKTRKRIPLREKSKKNE